MTQVTIDQATSEKLCAAKDVVRVVDEQGRVVGTFKPADVPPYDPSLIPPMSIEELRRREQEPGGYTTEEVLRKLKEL